MNLVRNAFLSLSLSLSLVALAAAGSPAPAHAGDPVPPDVVVKETTGKLQNEINIREKEFRADPKKLYKYVDEVVVPKFDTKYIAQLILARNWKAASEDQHKRFEVAFKDMLMHSYADALIEYHNAVKAEWAPLRMQPGDTEVTVQSKLIRTSGKPPVPIGFAMRLKDSEWKVYDIVIENLSLVQSFRSQISSEVRKSDLETVIKKLESGQAIAPPVKSSGASS